MIRDPRRLVLVLAFVATGLPAQPPPPPRPLPPVPVPPANQITQAKIDLGKILFFDEQLSSTNTVACATCHIPSANGTDPRLAVNPGLDGLVGTPDDKRASPGVQAADASDAFIAHAVFGVNPQVTPRTAPTMINAAYAPRLFWDGRAAGTFVDPLTGVTLIPGGAALESQAVGPILSDAEMAHQGRAWAEVVGKLAAVTPLKLASNIPAALSARLVSQPTYPDLFAAAFGTPDITPARIGMAIATYERVLVSNQTAYDRFLAGVPNALTQNQLRGLNVFRTNGRCAVCHAEPFLTDQTFRNVGLRPLAEDEGRFVETANPADRGRFKVPALRNVGLKRTFMHNGQFSTLTEVVDFYARGGDFPQNRDPVMGAINLPPQDRQALVDFLQNALLDTRVATETAPFDRPTLRTETSAAILPIASPGSTASNGRIPRMLAAVPASMPNPDFKLGLGEVRSGESAWLALSSTAAAPGTLIGGLPVGVDVLAPDFTLLPVALTGSGALGGTATFALALPDDPALAHLSLVAQWLVTDAFAPLGAATSPAVRLTLF